MAPPAPDIGNRTANTPTLYHRADAWLSRRGTIAAFVVAGLAFIVFAVLAETREYGAFYIENDFYMFYVSDTVLIQAGEAPEAIYHGPGYPLFLAAIEPLTGDFFIAARWIAVASMAVSGVLVYAITRQFVPAAGALAAELLFFTSQQIAIQSMTASTDALALAFVLGAFAALFWRGARPEVSAGLAGALAGYAYLVRYNSVFLLAAALIAILALDVYGQVRMRGRLRPLAAFFGAAFLVALPWFIVNWAANGSPLQSSNHLQFATFYTDGRADLDGTEAARLMFGSFADVIRHDPGHFVTHYVRSVVVHGLHTGYFEFVNTLIAGGALVGAAGLVFGPRRDPRALTLIASCFVFVAVAALTHWEDRYFITIAAIYCLLAAIACWRLPGWLASRGWALPSIFPGVAALALIVTSVPLSAYYLSDFLALDHPERHQVCPYFEGEGIEDALVVSRRAHVPAACGQRAEFFPLAKTTEELREGLAGSEAEYLLYGVVERRFRPELADELGDPAAAPGWLEPVFTSADGVSVLYRIVLPAPGE